MLSKNLYHTPVWVYFLILVMAMPFIDRNQPQEDQHKRVLSKQLIAKMSQANSRKDRCGKDSLCKIYGNNVRINGTKAMQFFAMVNGLQTRP